jgi:hypothetical protein
MLLERSRNGTLKWRRDTLQEVVSKDGIATTYLILRTNSIDLFKSIRLQKYAYYKVNSLKKFKQVLENKEVLYQLIGMVNRNEEKLRQSNRCIPLDGRGLEPVFTGPHRQGVYC